METKNKTFDKSFWIYISIFTVIIILICFLPSLFTSRSWFNLNFNQTGPIGDTIGGIMGPFVAIAAAILTFLAFWVQFKANEQQRQDIAKERFESKFYELLRMHRQNVEGIKIEGLEQREVFQEFYYELQKCYNFVEGAFKYLSIQEENSSFYKNFTNYDKINFSYIIFNYGYKNLYKFLKSQTTTPEDDLHLINLELEKTIGHYNKYWIKKDISINEWLEETIEIKIEFQPKRFEKNICSHYRPFSGQSQLLGHYFRNIFQIVKFVDSESSFLSQDQKQEYIKTLRAQLSDFEQLLLYYNALSDFGNSWFEGEKDSLMIRYKMVKNIPLTLIFGITPNDVFEKFNMDIKEKESYFEWDERRLKQ